MCALEKIAACEISFIPIGTPDYNSLIKQVLIIIESSDLETEVGSFSTVVRGESKKVLELIAHIYKMMDPVCDFRLDVKLSNICGCKE